jgi:exopolysaccharide biosynthesis polyprenyl glycosylphosphotransferase
MLLIIDLIKYFIKVKVIPFLKRWKYLLNTLLGVIDIFAIASAFQISFFINYHNQETFFFTNSRFLKLFVLILPIWLVILYLIQVAEIPRTKRYRVLFYHYFQSSVLVITFLMVVYFAFKLYLISPVFIVEFALLGFLFLFLARSLEYKLFKIYRSKGYNYINIVIIADDSAIPFIESMLSHKDWGYRIIAIFTGSPKIKEKYEKAIILLPDEYLTVLHNLMEVDIIDEVIYFKSRVIPADVRNTVRSCEELGVVFSLNYSGGGDKLTNAIKSEIGNQKFLTFINIPHNSFALAIKKIMDITLSVFIVICLTPILILIALIIKIDSPGAVLFRQARVGLRGRQFGLYKFRTMITNAENLKKQLEADNEADGPVFKIKDDPRVTRIGKFLRKTGLDELPQLFNVLKGEMSLIGPRPPLPSETIQYKRWQLRRLSVKPGLSCFWQIKPDRNNIKFEKWMELDLAYIDNWSLRLDFIILVKTIRTVFLRTGL